MLTIKIDKDKGVIYWTIKRSIFQVTINNTNLKQTNTDEGYRHQIFSASSAHSMLLRWSVKKHGDHV